MDGDGFGSLNMLPRIEVTWKYRYVSGESGSIPGSLSDLIGFRLSAYKVDPLQISDGTQDRTGQLGLCQES